MGSAPLAPGTTADHEHCPCVDLWRHIVSGNAETSHVLRIWTENTELVTENQSLRRRVRVLERKLGISGRQQRTGAVA